MAKESRTKYVILGLLASGAETGYDIKTFIENGISYFWSESYGQIYPTLKTLTESGLIKEVINETQGKRDKKRYVVTQEGLRVLDNWILSETQMVSPREEVLLKLFLCERSGGEAAEKVLTEHLNIFSEQLQQLLLVEQSLIKTDHPSKEYWLATLRFGINGCNMRVEWSKETLKNFKKAKIL